MAITAAFYNSLPPELPILFSKPWGQDQLAPKIYITIAPSVLLILFLIQFQIASVHIKKNQLIAQLVTWAQLVNSFLVLVSTIQLVFLLA